ncbi:MAG: hypothetical protein GF317_24705 [Candidatus Lokiarchaeota archaeon]|nr:hypothetical protein [Candidatus Lokiarchaeota archaeon]MBD3202562.1 hypothetical protein [Candidatus Lokiarchaeota archaeon]
MKKHITKFRGLIRVLSLEDYIMTKLARTDRTSTDINDILQLLIANRDFINWEYLHFRLDWLNIRKDFEDLIEIFNREIEPNFKDKAKEILTIYYRSKKKI